MEWMWMWARISSFQESGVPQELTNTNVMWLITSLELLCVSRVCQSLSSQMAAGQRIYLRVSTHAWSKEFPSFFFFPVYSKPAFIPTTSVVPRALLTFPGQNLSPGDNWPVSSSYSIHLRKVSSLGVLTTTSPSFHLALLLLLGLFCRLF